MELTLSLTPERGLSGCCLARIELSDKESLVVLLGGLVRDNGSIHECGKFPFSEVTI